MFCPVYLVSFYSETVCLYDTGIDNNGTQKHRVRVVCFHFKCEAKEKVPASVFNNLMHPVLIKH